MKEITISDEHKLPFGYFYEKAIPEPLTSVKPDEQIVDELAGSMPLSEIAKICEKPPETNIKRETKAQVDVIWNDGKLTILIYPSPFHDKHKALKYEWHTMPYIYRVTKYKNSFAEEKLNKIIYG